VRPPLRIVVIVGPTAGGKTRLGVELAHRIPSEIVSADSRQVYRGLDIGSGKDLEEYGRVSPPVPYHLVDVADPREVYSVLHYQRDCYRLLRDKEREAPFAAGRPLVMVGGSGLYVEAVLKGYRIPTVAPDEDLRRELMRRDRAELVRELGRLDPRVARETDCSSKKRVVRALEIVRYTGSGPARLSEPLPVRIEYAVFVLEPERGELCRRIDARLETRLAGGLIEEVEGLLAAGLSRERMDQLGLEYREVAAYLCGAKTREAMVSDLRRGIRKLAKRQRTWFRGFPRRGIEATPIESADPLRALLAWSLERP